MRLISMATHSRMKHMQEPLELYRNAIDQLFSKARQANPNYHNPILEPSPSAHPNPLVILIGSQKGLCGSFNSTLFHLFDKKQSNSADYAVITVGKRATSYIQKSGHGKLIAFYNTFGLHNVLTVADSLLREITQTNHTYSSVVMYGNSAASFFLQKPIASQILPNRMAPAPQSSSDTLYDWEQPAQEILSFLANQYILSQIQHALFQSLLAEHAARFISMDSSTRNAEIILEQMQRDYNKLRQAKITRELTELSSFFLS